MARLIVALAMLGGAAAQLSIDAVNPKVVEAEFLEFCGVEYSSRAGERADGGGVDRTVDGARLGFLGSRSSTGGYGQSVVTNWG